jgi:hypothetical protein
MNTFGEPAPTLTDFGYRCVSSKSHSEAPDAKGWQEPCSPDHYLPRRADRGVDSAMRPPGGGMRKVFVASRGDRADACFEQPS